MAAGDALSHGQEWCQCLKSPMRSTGPARRQPDKFRPWTRRQVRSADSWPTRRDQPVSVALSPAGDRLALSVGKQLSVLDITDAPRVTHQFPVACSLAPGLTWSPDGKLAFRDDDGQGRVADLSGQASPRGRAPDVGSRAGERDGLSPGQ